MSSKDMKSSTHKYIEISKEEESENAGYFKYIWNSEINLKHNLSIYLSIYIYIVLYIYCYTKASWEPQTKNL